MSGTGRQQCLQVAGQIETPRPPNPIMRRRCADCGEKRVTYGRDMSGQSQCKALANESQGHAHRTQTRPHQVMSNAQPQACHGARLATAHPTSSNSPARSADPGSRPRRWRDAVAQLLALQADYADWLAVIPENLQDSNTARTLEAIVDLNIAALADISRLRELRRG